MIRACTAIALASCMTPSIGSAQEHRPAVTLVPAGASRWDAAGQITWLGEHPPNGAIQWDRWFDVAAGGGMLGYYWTPHLKAELDVSTSTKGEMYSIEPLVLPGSTVPFYLQRDHEFRISTASAGLIGQFFENAWFHPFVGGGIELVHERERIETTLPFGPPRDPRAPAIVPAPEPETWVRYATRPYVATGFKAYVSERGFIRTDLRASWSSEGLAALAWRSGVGVDF